MSKIIDGGPAFPSPALVDATDERNFQRDGMSLRDWFAGQIIKGLIERFPINEASDVHLCAVAYKLANDMIVERTQKREEK